MKKGTSILLLLLFLFLGCGAAVAQPGWEERFYGQVRGFIREIADKDPQFADWKEARLQVEPMGANSRQWIIYLEKDRQKLGYILVAEDPHGTLRLLEYGTKGLPLFDETVLRELYPRFQPWLQDAAKVYNGLASFYRLNLGNRHWVFDAKTGERIPEEFLEPEMTMERNVEAYPNFPDTLKTAFTKELSPWDEDFPIAPILYPARAVQRPEEVLEADVYLQTVIWNHVHLLLPVKGLHIWDGDQVFIGLEQEGYRFIPLPEKTDEPKGSPATKHPLIRVMSGMGEKSSFE